MPPRGKALTRDAGLQLQLYAWTGNNNGNVSQTRTRRVRVGGRRNLLPGGVAMQLTTMSFSHCCTSYIQGACSNNCPGVCVHACLYRSSALVNDTTDKLRHQFSLIAESQ